MNLKLISPIPKDIRLKKGLGPIAASLDIAGFFKLPEARAKTLLAIEYKARAYAAAEAKWSIEAEAKAFEAAQNAFRANPTPENESAFGAVSDRQKSKALYSKMRSESFKAGEAFIRAEGLPLIIDVIADALDALKSHLDELRERQQQLRSEFGLPLTIKKMDERGQPVQHTPDDPVTEALAHGIRILDLKMNDLKASSVIGIATPSSLLTEIVYFFVE